MRICLVSVVSRAHSLGGMEDHLHCLSTGLARRGHDVHVITARHPAGLAEETVEGVHTVYLDAVHLNQLDARFRQLLLDEFLRQHRERPFDVVHSQSTSALALVRAGLHRSVPIVVMYHGNYLSFVRAAAQRTLRAPSPRNLAREAKGLLALSRLHFPQGNWRIFRACEAIVPSELQVAGTRWSHLLRRERIHVVPNGVDVTLFHPRPREALRAELGVPATPTALFVGRLDRGKGVHVAVEAVARAGGQTGLVVVGEGPQRQRLLELSAALGLDGRVQLVGRQPAERVAAYMAAADVFVFPTLLPEAAPLVLPQAMASGLPTVASRIGAIPEMIGPAGEAGLLVGPGDVEALAGALRELIADPERRARLGEAARAHALEAYGAERMLERTLAVYELARRR